MARIQCPSCGQVANLNLAGKYLVECHQCGKKFTVYILRQRPALKFTITCPQCGHNEAISLTELTPLQVTCDQCGHKFMFEPKADDSPTTPE